MTMFLSPITLPRPRGRPGACLVVLCACLGATAARGQTANEPSLKAAFLHNFIRFTEWPADVERQGRPPVLCVLDADDVARELETVERAAAPGGLGIVRRVGAGDDLRACALLYMGRVDGRSASTILGGLAGSPVLTVSDRDDWTRHGGVVNFYVENNHMRFAINVAAARRAHLQISSRLLSLARIVEDEPNGGR